MIFPAFLRVFPGREYCNPFRPDLLLHFVTYHTSGHVGPRHTYGVYPEEIDGLKRDYEKLWGEVSKVLRELSELVQK